jgi:hypothetical protein
MRNLDKYSIVEWTWTSEISNIFMMAYIFILFILSDFHVSDLDFDCLVSRTQITQIWSLVLCFRLVFHTFESMYACCT